ncbi:conjugal transfer protein [Methylocaldum sp. BRCS4]|uniref:conjugal transfer protein TrbF n=1 Tax=Methylocaldum sp. GT1BW TaxID=3438964 RepID=UPI0012EC572E|nr:conjugal transfer protein [Methylocaldum sp. BRCS4]
MASNDSTNPYISARREWNERYGDYIAQKRNWQLAAFISLGLSFLLVCALVYQSSQSSVQPFIVEVDKIGQAVAVAPADKAVEFDERIVRAQVANFISNVRSVTTDTTVQKQWLDKAYAMLGPASLQAMNDHFKANSPFAIARTSKVQVDIISALPLSKESWQVQWEETRKGLDGRLESRTRWQAVLEIGFTTPKTAEVIMLNPTGLVIRGFSWTQQL